jgi:iron complex transport system substrate-binding protein
VGAIVILGGAPLSGPPTAAAQAPAKRIISLVPSVTEMLFAVGAGSQVVAVSSYDNFPPEVAKLPRVGALLDPDVERILSLKPDLVITYASQSDLETQLARAGIRVFSDRFGGVAVILQTIRDVGRVTGHAAQGDSYARDIQARLDEIRKRVQGRPRPRAMLVFGRAPGTLQQLYAAGGRGFLHDVLDVAGGQNVFADMARESVQPSHEMLLTRAPEVVLELRASRMLPGDDGEDPIKAWSLLPSIPAVKSRRVLALQGDYLLAPGPRVALAAEAIARALHPAAFGAR